MFDNTKIRLELTPVAERVNAESTVKWRAVLEVQVNAVRALPFGVVVDGGPDVDPRVAVGDALKKAADAFGSAVPFRKTS